MGAAFFAHSCISGAWAARVPAIKDALGLTDAQLGLALFGMAVGTLVGGRLGGLIAARLGAWRTVRLGLPVFGAGAGAAVAAAGFAVFSLGMFAARMAGDRLAQAVGPVRLVLASTAAAACGLGLALAVGNAVAGVIGFGLLGLGLGPVVPTVISAAAGAGLVALESVVSQVFTIGYVGGVSGPAAIGVASGQVGLRAALVIPLCLVVCITATSRRLATAAGAPAAG